MKYKGFTIAREPASAAVSTFRRSGNHPHCRTTITADKDLTLLSYPPTAGMGILGFGEKYGWLMQDDWKMLLVPFMGVKDDHFPDREDTMRVLRCPQIVANEDGKRGQGQYAMNASGTAPFKDSLNLGIGGYSVGASWNVRPTTESQVRHPAELVAVGDIGAGRSLGLQQARFIWRDRRKYSKWLQTLVEMLLHYNSSNQRKTISSE